MRYSSNSFYEKALNFINQQCRSLAPKVLQGFQSQLSQAYRERHPTKNFITIESILTYAVTRIPGTSLKSPYLLTFTRDCWYFPWRLATNPLYAFPLSPLTNAD